ncbi:Calcineurin subunit B type 1 [Hondaea fermentalgiana]|uniref:Calcineurin subunit B type 1 n=1 Tax=Hondaea fermentalgiana TaxID=2315210 RepID=A0A2R5GBE2_9STRA|nr:Calcineurin subunit B type 1 [Hondaea fermentalgiana]|eukprot:GBG28300.1 Calcineurin subunit B type 1 [Hondaea fermentalgiana]
MTLKQFYLLKVENGLMETLDKIQREFSPFFLRSATKKEKKRDGNMGLRLFELFVTIDDDGSGEIALQEFYQYFGIVESKFVERLFAEFDLDGSEHLSFEEFIVGVWNFCTLNLTRLCKYSMDIFDIDGRQTIDKYQCDALIRMKIETRLQKALEMDLGAFTAFAAAHPALLKPVLDVQAVLRARILGAQFWEERTQLRTDTFGELEPTDSILVSKRRAQLTSRATFRINASGTSSRVVPELATPQMNPKPAIANDAGLPSGIGTTTSSADIFSGLLSRSTSSTQRNSLKGSTIPVQPAGVDALGELFSEDSSQENIYVFDIEQNEVHEAAQKCFRKVQRCKKAFLETVEAYEHNSIEIFATQSPEQVQENESLARFAAKAKHRFQLAVNELEVLGKKCIDAAEKQLYAQALSVVEEDARYFFRTKEGREHLRIVGGEHALREERAATRFGQITKKARMAGEKKARNEYIARRAREQNDIIADIVRDRNETHVANIKQLYKDHKLFTVAQDELVTQWQWQKILDQESKQFYFHCPGLQVTVWTEPYLLNSEGWCEDPSCENDALLRCASCHAEYCADCDMILHSCGPQRNHNRRAQIPPEEVEWRIRLRKLPTDVQKIVTRETCHDMVELTRRQLQEQSRVDAELFGGSESMEASFSGAGLLPASLTNPR